MTPVTALAMDEVRVPLPRAASIIGSQPQRLRRWANTELLRPQLYVRASARRIVFGYSVDDLIVGKVIVALEQAGAKPRHVRAVVRQLLATGRKVSELGEFRWSFDASEVFFSDHTGEWYGSSDIGQTRIAQALNLQYLRGEVEAELTQGRTPDQVGRCERRRGVQRSAPVFMGTRIPVSTVQDWLAAGHDTARILDAYPILQPADVDLARRELASTAS
jgi:uncharacterized protein (DUF433 family)